MKFLVLSHTHSLLPFAYRLQLSGADVQPVVVVQAFEAAWRGKMKPSPRDGKGRLDPSWLSELSCDVDTDNCVVLTDDWRLQEKFREATGREGRIYGVHQQHHTTDGGLEGPLRLGAWFDGENLHGHHLLVIDRGAWPGGMGPSIDGGLTMVRIDIPETMWMMDQLANQQVDELKTSGFRGLVQFNLNFQTPSGEPEVDGMLAGWPFLHTHAFVSELEDLAGLLEKGVDTQSSNHPSQTLLPRKFVSVLPVSRPPWPTRKARFRFDLAEVGGLTQEQMARVFWHDVQVDQEGGKLTTAGLDGLVGVARGAADTNELALVRALEVALRLQLPEKQFRSDAGRRVQSVLAELEGRFGVLL
jgi:hypothetical protein